jgi:hypothetical protein
MFVTVEPLPAGYAMRIEGHVKANPDDATWTLLGEYIASGRCDFKGEPPGPAVLASDYGAELLAKAKAWAKAGKPAKGVAANVAAPTQPTRPEHKPLPSYRTTGDAA